MADGFVWRGMQFYEREAVAEATEIALRETRQRYLPLLEEWRSKAQNLGELVIVEGEIRRLHRLLGIEPSEETRRAATRERVRQHRERKKQGIVLRPRRQPGPPVIAETIAEGAKQQAEAWREIERIKRARRA